jgi:hypothetical protein
MQPLPFPCYLLSLRPKYLSQHPVLKTHSFCFFLNVRCRLSCPSITTHKIIILYILLFILLARKMEDANFCTE